MMVALHDWLKSIGTMDKPAMRVWWREGRVSEEWGRRDVDKMIRFGPRQAPLMVLLSCTQHQFSSPISSLRLRVDLIGTAKGYCHITSSSEQQHTCIMLNTSSVLSIQLRFLCITLLVKMATPILPPSTALRDYSPLS